MVGSEVHTLSRALTEQRAANMTVVRENKELVREVRALDCTSECWYYGVIQEPSIFFFFFSSRCARWTAPQNAGITA